MELPTLIGTTGLMFLLTAFLLNEMDKVDENSISYNILNLIGSGSLIFYAYSLNSWIFIILNAVWSVVAAAKLISITMKKVL